MARQVVMSRQVADEIVELQNQADQVGRRPAFRRAWRTIWQALQKSSLPPDEGGIVFGELLYHTKNHPLHAISLGCVHPLAVRFAVCEEPVVLSGTSVQFVVILKVILMS